MYMKSIGIALFFAIYGRTALAAALPDSCELGETSCDACTPRESEFEPPGVGQVWYSRCCTVSKTNTEDPPVTESKKYCFSYYLTGYPNNLFSSTKPICSETGSGTLAWIRKGQCGTSSGTAPYTEKTEITTGCPGEYDSNNAYDTGDMVEDNGVVFTCSGAAAFCNLNAPDLRGVGEHYWKPTNSCSGTANPTASPVFDNPQDGCPEEFDSSTTYEANDRVSVTREDGRSVMYTCKAFPASKWCSVPAYSPLNTDKQCNGKECWPLAWTRIGGCTGSYSPTGTPTFDPANVEGCPEEYDDGSKYYEGDRVSVTAAGEDYGKIYECKGWPESDHCGTDLYSPLNTDKLCNGKVCWPIAWTYIKGCTGTITPTATPTFDPADVEGCPEVYNGGAEYEEGDKVSVTAAGEDYGKIYECKAWPDSKYCGQEAFSPLNTARLCNDKVCWPTAWTYLGGCAGTITPTATPTFDPADVGGCPNEFEEGTDYEEGDKMSIIADGEDYGKIYKCKGWPVTGHCKSEAYSPLNTAQACGGEVCWPVAWSYEGGCTGTITPTAAPAFKSLSKWDKEGCPPEYVPNNSAYKPEDYVSVPKNEDNTYGVVWQCKNAMSAPWCQNEGYAPGTHNGGQAWEKVGHCDGTISPTVSPTMLASNPNPIKRVCQFKYKLDTTSDGEYIVLQAGSWEKGGTSFATVTGGAPYDLFKAGHVVRDGTDARKCNRWPFTPYCNQFSPFVCDASDYNPILSRKGWDKVTCENVVSVVDDVTGIEDEFNPAIPGPVFASNGDLLVEADGTCTNYAINPEDYFKSSPALKGCRKCESGYGFGTPDDTRSKCFPCQSGYISKVVDGKTQCVVAPSSTRDKLMKSLLLTVSSEDALNNKGSPQEKAFLWVTTSPLQPGEDDAQIIQQYILAVFYYATGGAGWKDKEGWLESSNECTWEHVVCNVTSGVVTKLEPPYCNNLVGSIPSEVGSLDSLEELGLGRNQLTGGIPAELGQLDNLVNLFLYDNQLTGEIPAELGGLGSLEILDFSYNDLTGGIPTELGELGSLRYLGLYGNDLTGGIDVGICELSAVLLYVEADCDVCNVSPPGCCSSCV